MAIETLDKRQQAANRQHTCPHFLLQPRWSAAADMGFEEKASDYVCESCGEAFSPTSKQTGKKHPFRRAIEVLFGEMSNGRDEVSLRDDESLRVLRIDRAFLKQDQPKVHFATRSVSLDWPQDESIEAPGDRALASRPTDIDVPYYFVPPLS